MYGKLTNLPKNTKTKAKIIDGTDEKILTKTIETLSTIPPGFFPTHIPTEIPITTVNITEKIPTKNDL
ncbi:Hypothetical protein MCYN_0289 [Mycoplasmopsis cynos C142]|uniref:Uncharacterized protein n=1 Tax=Mycoplasmopsis cynos (strain C142) TaxID=1246955 RepID=L0RWN6_MYCC1|nr:Hypothetical protein MCYN_0289 [Mycoplasmopsis cynos C142]